MKEFLDNCPVCDNDTFEQFLPVKDLFLTKEDFTIMACSSCGFRFVNPRPGIMEIGRYYQSDAYISHNSSGLSLFNAAYRIARHFAIRGKNNLIKRNTKGNRLLDIGCGTGEVLKFCKSQGFIVQGVEPTETARRVAMENNGLDVKETLAEIVAAGSMFNCITLWHVLEHIHDLNTTLDQIKSLLDKNGTLIIALPNSNSYDAGLYGNFWAAYDVPRHLYHFTQETFLRLAGKHGFVVEKILPQQMDAYYVSLLSEKYKTGKSNFPMALINGFRSNRVAKNPGLGHSSLIFLLSAKKM
jgi:2-polyprenyl-3-methyl-5-hydroxy-6-metoxy-1,4-benzoquinol methylase